MEYWLILNFANPGIMGSRAFFRTLFADPIESRHDPKALQEFRQLTAPFILRRLKTDKSVISDLPDKIVSDELCSLTVRQSAIYKSLVKNTMARLNNRHLDGYERSALVITLINQLKQLCNSPVQYLKDNDYADPKFSVKAQRLIELCAKLKSAGQKTLIFTQYKETGYLIQNWLKEVCGRTPDFLHGSLSVSERGKMVDNFQNKRSHRFMVLSLKAAGTGLNLTAASAVIHYDLWWNSAVEAQATDRAYRIGQQSNVEVYRFITANTFE